MRHIPRVFVVLVAIAVAGSLLAAAAPPDGAAGARPRVLRFGRLLDGTGKVLTDAVVVVEGDPLADINAVIGGVRFMMKGGAVVVDRRSVR